MKVMAYLLLMDIKFAAILTNPPIRAGKETDLFNFMNRAYE